MAELTGNTGQLQKACIRVKKASPQNSPDHVLASAANVLKGAGTLAGGQIDGARFVLPFNPSELTFEAQGGGKKEIKNLQKKDDNSVVETYTYEPMTPTVTMKVKLTFDNSTNPEGSIQGEVEGFLAAIRNPDTQEVEFHWNQLQFCGTLTQVSAQYTMFSSHGRPVRATVDMNIDGKKEQVEAFSKDYRKLLGY